jgi:hypothetical protein
MFVLATHPNCHIFGLATKINFTSSLITSVYALIYVQITFAWVFVHIGDALTLTTFCLCSVPHGSFAVGKDDIVRHTIMLAFGITKLQTFTVSEVAYKIFRFNQDSV